MSVFIKSRLYHKCLAVDIAVTVIFFSDEFLHHCDLIKSCLELLIFVMVECNVLYLHLVRLPVKFTHQKLISEYVGVCYWALDFYFTALLLQKLLSGLVNAKRVVDNSRTAIGVKCLEDELCLAPFFEEDVSE